MAAVYVKDEYLRGLESDVEDFEERVDDLETEVDELERQIRRAETALTAAWDLMRPEARAELVRVNDYAEEFFWNEPKG